MIYTAQNWSDPEQSEPQQNGHEAHPASRPAEQPG